MRLLSQADLDRIVEGMKVQHREYKAERIFWTQQEELMAECDCGHICLESEAIIVVMQPEVEVRQVEGGTRFSVRQRIGLVCDSCKKRYVDGFRKRGWDWFLNTISTEGGGDNGDQKVGDD